MTDSGGAWHSDPYGRHELRYWDGSAWTEHVATGSDQSTDPRGAAPPVATPSAPQAPSGWHADPLGRHELRFWDGTRWTEHVASQGRQTVDPLGAAPSAAVDVPAARPASVTPQPVVSWGAQKIQKQVQKAGLTNTSGSADLSLLNEPVLVINQKGKLVEMRAEYAIHDQHGRQLGAVRGRRMSTRMQVVDMAGRQVMELRREGTIFSAKITVTGPGGAKIGRIVPSVSFKQIDRDFKLEGAGNQPIGSVFGEDKFHTSQRKKNREFNVQDPTGAVVARISKTRAGLAKELFTKGDNYVLDVPGELGDPLRSMAVAVVLVIDDRFHQG